MKPFLIALVTFLVLISAIQGCTENPTDVGRGFLQPKDIPQIRIDTLYATSHSTRVVKINTEGANRVLLGRNSSYESIAMLKFTGLSVGTLDTIVITDAKLQLHAVSHFGDSLAPIAFSVYKAIAAWDTLSYDSLAMNPGNYYVSTPVSVLAPTSLDDTTTIQCSLDTALVNSWFTSVGSLLNYGLILKASNIAVIKGFGSFNNLTTYARPALIINYVRNGIPGTVTYNSGTSRFAATIPLSSLAINPDLMYVQGGVAYRGQLYFSLQSLPKAAQILKADLEMTLDATDSRLNSYTADSLYSYYINADSSTGIVPIPSKSSSDAKGRELYTFAIRDYVRTWANTTSLQSLQVGAKGELNSLDLFTVYGTTSSADARPRLIITSTLTLK